MPIGRYMAWVGTALLALLFVANWFQPQSFAEPAAHEINRPVIRIASVQQTPERIVIDTNLPTIVPSPTLTAESIPDEPPLQPEHSFTSITPHTTATSAESRKPKAKKKQMNQVTAKAPPAAPTMVVTSSRTGTDAPPIRLSFANIISGQLVRELFNLH
jgi:hypothetical protein